MKRDGRVSIGRRIENEGSAFPPGLLDPADQLPFGIGLPQVQPDLSGQLFQAGMNVSQRVPAVNLGLAGAEQIEIRAAEDIYGFGHGSPFALDSGVLQEGNRRRLHMKITLNGEARDIAPGTTVAQLVLQLSAETGRDPRGIAVERNMEIVPKSEHALTTLSEGDRLELVQFVGGG